MKLSWNSDTLFCFWAYGELFSDLIPSYPVSVETRIIVTRCHTLEKYAIEIWFTNVKYLPPSPTPLFALEVTMKFVQLQHHKLRHRVVKPLERILEY